MRLIRFAALHSVLDSFRVAAHVADWPHSAPLLASPFIALTNDRCQKVRPRFIGPCVGTISPRSRARSALLAVFFPSSLLQNARCGHRSDRQRASVQHPSRRRPRFGRRAAALARPWAVIRVHGSHFRREDGRADGLLPEGLPQGAQTPMRCVVLALLAELRFASRRPHPAHALTRSRTACAAES